MLKPTKEQETIIEGAKNNDLLKVTAFAGGAKTTSLVMITNEIKVPTLYLAYNKSMAVEARTKFPNHVVVLTVHGLAYRHIGKDYAHKLTRPLGRYRNVAGTGSEIALYYKIPDVKVNKESFISKAYLGLIARDMVGTYEQSSQKEISIKNHFPTQYKKDLEKRYPDANLPKIQSLVMRVAKQLWEDRTDALSEVLCTHDTYLKLFQLSKPILEDYKMVLLDEAQDSNEVTLSIFMNQKHAKRILVGDRKQAIYGWRGAVNAMEKVNCPEFKLTKSFRFGQAIADVASTIINDKVFGFEEKKSVVGHTDVIDFDQPYTILFRKNTTLIYEALNLIEQEKDVSINIDVKDFINMLTSAMELFMGNIKKVKHDLILPFTSWDDLLTEAKSSPELSRLSTIVKNGDAYKVLDLFKTYKKKDNAQVTLTTAHKAKGLEYDYVLLADDFPSPYDENGNYKGLTFEEENLLYVASTRAKRVLQYNSTVKDMLLMNKNNNSSLKGIPVENVKMAVLSKGSSEKDVVTAFNKIRPLEGDNFQEADLDWLNRESDEGGTWIYPNLMPQL